MATDAPEIIKAFNVDFKPDDVDKWFANAQKRLLTFHPRPAGGAGDKAVQKATLIELIRTVLPELLLNSYYIDDEWRSWNAANEENDAKSGELAAELAIVQNKLSPPELYKLKDAERRQLMSNRTRIDSLLYGAEGPTARILDRKDLRRKTLRRRQTPFITQIKAFIDHSSLLTGAEKAEVTLFLDGLVPYVTKKKEGFIVSKNGTTKKMYTLSDSSARYRELEGAFNVQLATLIPSVTGSEEISRGVAKLTANTRAAAAAVSRVPGFEEFNADMNRVLFNPGASNEEVIEKIAKMTPEMLNRMETRARNEATRQALVARLKALGTVSPHMVPKAPGDKGFDQFANLVQRLKRLKETRSNNGRGDGGAAGGAGRGSNGGGRRTRRRMRRTRR